jgi:hypothetical protein
MSTLDVTTISSADWSPQVGVLGQIVEGLDDIRQAIEILLKTPKGSDPHRPPFGADIWRYLDLPTNVSVPHIIREATLAIQQWEPRATLISVKATPNNSQVTVVVTWQATVAGVQQTEVVYDITPAAA